ncbi:hypothetical protein HDU98_011086 [Podochytrium sp. JEL0797]|nr:hypothetical protein HDU98_011086 [Podochytrium sp. JEL0797]
MAPEIPTSPLSGTYLTLSQKLVSLTNSPTTPNATDSDIFEGSQEACANLLGSMPLISEEEEANAIRSKIAKILHQIQVAAVTNPSVNLLCYRPIAVAYQLCVIEHALLRQIHSNDVLIHKPPQCPAPSLQAASNFFNYFTRLVECSILEQTDVSGRVKTVCKWFKVAGYLKKFNNLQSLKGITSALTTPPIIRLKKMWAQLKKKNAAELQGFEELVALLSEQNNYNAYRNYVKANQTRPMVPFFGVILHDITYLVVIAKKEGMVDLSADRRIQEIQKFIRYCGLGPRYSYDMLIDLDAEKGAFSGTPGMQKKGVKRRVKGGGLSESGMEVLGMLFKDLNHEEIGSFISHWLLTRKWMSEKEVDDLSLLREPKATQAVKGLMAEAPPDEKEGVQQQLKIEDEIQVKGVEKPQLQMLAPKEIVIIPSSPNLTRARLVGGSASFIEAIKETAYTLVAKHSGTSTPIGSSESGRKANKIVAKLNSELPRGRQLDHLLRRRQKSLTNIDAEASQGISKSVSMDAGLSSRANSPERTKESEKAGSFDSVSGSMSQSAITQEETSQTTSAYVQGFVGVESEELKRKLEFLMNSPDAPRLVRRSSSSAAPTSIMSPIKESSSANTNTRHGGFFSFFSHTEDTATNATESSSTGRRSEGNALNRKPPLQKIESASPKGASADQSRSLLEANESTQKSGTAPLDASNCRRPDGVKEKAVKGRRRASSAGNAEAVKAALTAEPKNVAEGIAACTILSQELSGIDGEPTDDRNSVATIKTPALHSVKTVKAIHKSPSTEPAEKLADLSAHPATSPASVSPNSGVLGWGSKFVKSAPKSPIQPLSEGQEADHPTVFKHSKAKKLSLSTPPGSAPGGILSIHADSPLKQAVAVDSQADSGAQNTMKHSPVPVGKPQLPGLPQRAIPPIKSVPPVIPPKPAQLKNGIEKARNGLINSDSTSSLHKEMK